MTYGVVDFFCGVGGLTCGLESVGLDVVAGYDLDASCEYTYTHNNNAHFMNKNVEDITGQRKRSLLKKMDWYTSGLKSKVKRHSLIFYHIQNVLYQRIF